MLASSDFFLLLFNLEAFLCEHIQMVFQSCLNFTSFIIIFSNSFQVSILLFLNWNHCLLKRFFRLLQVFLNYLELLLSRNLFFFELQLVIFEVLNFSEHFCSVGFESSDCLLESLFERGRLLAQGLILGLKSF